jgi:shikimate dehydrogenase
MRYLGIIGYPLRHSLSPIFQQAALDHLGLDIIYQAWPTPEDGLEMRVTGLRAPTVVGANVTIPHKEACVPLMDELDDLVERVGALNTIVNRGGQLHGYNTDVAGFLRALREDAGFDPKGKRVLVVGAGGAARAVVLALAGAGAASIVVINRTFHRAAKLVEDLRPAAGETSLSALPDMYASWATSTVGCSLLVNCTSVGAAGTAEEKESPVPEDVIHPGVLVYDLIYRPEETVLMRRARERGARVIGGLPMLIYQGAASFKIWTGLEPPVDIMFQAARKALAEERRL